MTPPKPELPDEIYTHVENVREISNGEMETYNHWQDAKDAQANGRTKYIRADLITRPSPPSAPDVFAYGDSIQHLRNLVGLARLGAAGLWKYDAALKDAEACIQKFDEALGGPVCWPCGCSWHETSGVTFCEECAKEHDDDRPIKTPLELFEGGDMNLKSSAGIKKYEFNPYAIRRIERALKPCAVLSAQRHAISRPQWLPIKSAGNVPDGMLRAYSFSELPGYVPCHINFTGDFGERKPNMFIDIPLPDAKPAQDGVKENLCEAGCFDPDCSCWETPPKKKENHE